VPDGVYIAPGGGLTVLNGGFFPTAEAEAFVAAIDDVRERASSRGGFDASRVGLVGALGGGSSRRTSNPVPDAEEDGAGSSAPIKDHPFFFPIATRCVDVRHTSFDH
jgi:hypothetical protein